ncbi:alcohol dehydrogenase catalytic domain-containing protein [Comamonas sp. Tr-654]|uniref:zinc-binding dehydrogenase n=1 Tax=Comamonas sp. Tr-654 TaxID=2608341 RepID=UPI00141E3FD3|nr:alcohol dehydrogenase catalytic domain-containing protein [Comamonas sp. Tr-654]NIF82679.1 alcohol dehydrogenase catalytic domain-containing protein [Comamonas sp. Tr-654]
MKATYKAFQVTKPGVLELVERVRPVPGSGEVLLELEVCGICGADAADINAKREVPRVPGHEVIGRIVEVGVAVPTIWRVGMRVGVGRLGGHCNECSMCRQGLFQLCRNQQSVGSSCDGGYAEMMLARATGLVAIPDALNSIEAAPLLCAGLATFNAMRKSGAQAGDLVAIQGVGGLGHLALQYARKMGFKVVAVGRGDDIAAEVKVLGAHHYINTNTEDPVESLQVMGGAQLILTTITDSVAASKLVSALAPQGKLLVVGVGREPLTLSSGFLVAGERVIEGSITGTPYDSERTLDFSVLADVRPLIETMPLERAPEAFDRMASGQAKFRMVLTMGR